MFGENLTRSKFLCKKTSAIFYFGTVNLLNHEQGKKFVSVCKDVEKELVFIVYCETHDHASLLVV
jgi:hypothetical protein